MICRFVVAIALVLTVHNLALAQDPPAVASGAKVRVFAPSLSKDPIVGKVVSIGPDSLVLSPRNPRFPRRLGVPVRSLELLQVSIGRGSGRRNVLKGVRNGIVYGGLAGTVLGFAFTRPDEGVGRVDWSFAGMLGGAVIGIPLGALFGSAYASEKWEDVPLDRIHLNASPRGSGGMMLSATYRF